MVNMMRLKFIFSFKRTPWRTIFWDAIKELKTKTFNEEGHERVLLQSD